MTRDDDRNTGTLDGDPGGSTATPGPTPCSPPPRHLGARIVGALAIAATVLVGGWYLARPTVSNLPTQSLGSGAPTTPSGDESQPQHADVTGRETPDAVAGALSRELLDEAADELSCGHLDVVTRDGRSWVTGVAATETGAAKARAIIQGTLGATVEADFDIQVEPQPFCGALVAMRDLRGSDPPEPRVTLNLNPVDYKADDPLVVTVTAGGEGGHLVVDFLDQTGPVVHMTPTRLRPDSHLGAGESARLGAKPSEAGAGERFYTIAPPFGRAMVMAIISKSPLFTEIRPELEEAQSYIKALASAIERERAAGGWARASVVFIETRER